MADNQPFGNELLLSLAKNPELMSILGSIPKGIFSWLGSRGIRKETKKQMTADRASLEGMISKQIFDPYMVAGLEKTQTYQEAAQAGNRLDAGYNLDIGSGLGGIMENTLGERQSRLGANIKENEIRKKQVELAIHEALFGNSAANYRQVM